MNQKEKYEKFQKIWGKLVAKAWADELFKQRLLKNTAQVLKENGIEDAPGISYIVHENSHKVRHLVIAQRPNLSDEDLKSIAGGSDWCADGCTG